jgi:hypothetical protein
MITARFDCLACGQTRDLADVGSGTASPCACGEQSPPNQAAIDGGRLLRCPLCGTDDMYVQKDFPERVGVAIVVTGVVLATIAWARYSWFGTFGVLFGAFAIDWILFHTRKDVTVCYRCLAQFRDAVENPAHRAFDLGVGERYRQERIRKEELRRQQRTPVRSDTP